MFHIIISFTSYLFLPDRVRLQCRRAIICAVQPAQRCWDRYLSTRVEIKRKILPVNIDTKYLSDDTHMLTFHRHKNDMHRLFCLFASILIHIRRSPSAVARKHRSGSSAFINRHQSTRLRLVIPRQKKLSRSREKQTKEGTSHKLKPNSETWSLESQLQTNVSAIL